MSSAALTHKLTATAFTYEALAPLALKGKSRPVAAWLARETDAAPERPGATRATPMVGREAELATCLQAVDRLRTGEGGLLLITGEAGIGKTRLLEELRLRAAERGVGWLEGRTLSFGRSISYWPFLEIVQQDAGIDSDDGRGGALVEAHGSPHRPLRGPSPEVLPYLATLLSVPLPEELASKVALLDGEAMGHQLYRASRLYFTRLAQEKPLVVVFEDVHWLDASSAALLEHLLPLINELPVLVCCVARPELDTALTRVQQLARRRLRRPRDVTSRYSRSHLRSARRSSTAWSTSMNSRLGFATSFSPRRRATRSSSRRSCAASSTSAALRATNRRTSIGRPSGRRSSACRTHWSA